MTMEWKEIAEDFIFEDSKFYLVGVGNYNRKASRFDGKWYDAVDGRELSFTPTHYTHIDPVPKIINLKVGDYVRKLSNQSVIHIMVIANIPEFKNYIKNGIYEIVDVNSRK